MTANFWVQAEIFYESVLLAIIVIVFILLFAAIFVKSIQPKRVKVNKPTNPKVFRGIISAALVVTAIGLVGHFIYHPYLDEVPLINPLLRDRNREFMGYQYYSDYETDYYMNMNYIDSLRRSALYEESQHLAPVTYLGTENTLYYFENDEQELFRVSSINVELLDNLETAQLIGSSFSLVDPSFEAIGFKNPPNVMFERLEIPADQADTEYNLDNPTDVRNNNYAVDDWIF